MGVVLQQARRPAWVAGTLAAAGLATVALAAAGHGLPPGLRAATWLAAGAGAAISLSGSA